MKARLYRTAVATAATTVYWTAGATAADAQAPVGQGVIDEIVVTARLREENLQDIPDSITAFTARDIEAAGINDVQDFIDMMPNVSMRKTWRSGNTFITIRGITSGAQGWPPVSYVVDGVRASSLDAINEGALIDIERIEVLRGPQGALYGSGAIGGAINVVTAKPTDEFSGRVSASYGKGNDAQVSGLISGALIPGRLRYRINAYARDSDGLVDSNHGEDLDFVDQKTLRARFDFAATENLELDLRASYTTSDNGALFQDKVARADLIDEFDSAAAPGPRRRVGMLGNEDRKISDVVLKADWTLPFATLTAVTGYQDIDSLVFGSVSFDEPPLAAAQTTLRAELFGDAAAAGQNIDEIQYVGDYFETWTADVRLTSASNQRLRWIVGSEYMARDNLAFFELGHLVAPLPGTEIRRTGRYDSKEDKFWGIYGQLSYDLTDALELTLAGRYDRNRYTSTRVSGREGGVPIPVPNVAGMPVDRLVAEDSKFQPKAQLSYDWTDTLMTYLTYSEGFRSGFFNTGNLTLPESTKNYEIGIKSEWLSRTLTLNATLFHTDYSNQQVSQTITAPPFRTTINLPETDIDGAELELTLRPTSQLQLSAGAGYTDSALANGIRSPVTPEWTYNGAAQYAWALGEVLELVGRVDYRYQSSQFMRANEQFPMGSKQYVDARLNLQSGSWTLKMYVENLTNTQQATSFGAFAGAFVRSYSLPRSYGVEASYRF